MPANHPPRKLLHLGWDAADWKLLLPLVESGQMPNLAALIERGCMGQISTIHPVYSPMLWTSIATGKRPHKHGVLGFSEPLPDGSGVRPVSGLSRKTKAYWNIFNQLGWRGHVVGWWPSHPAEPINGVMISNICHHAIGPEGEPWPVPPGGMHPPELVETLAELRVNPNELAPEMVEAFIPRAKEIDQDKDKRLAGCMKTLAECATVQNWAMYLATETEWDYLAVYFDAMDHFAHGFMKYHPPRREFIPERDFDLYSGVMTTAAKFHDMMLGALLSAVPEDVTVILNSDHGFHPDELRPHFIAPIPAGPADEHRDFGILVMAGPGIKKDELLHGASILDIAPTLLTLQGLPLGDDMDGRPLLAAFEQSPEVLRIPSWDDLPGDDGRHPADLKPDPESEKAALEQLIALGYVQRPSDDAQEAVRETVREQDINLAEALMDASKEAEALPILRRLHAGWPEEWRFALRRAMCCKTLGRVDELREVVEDLHVNRRPQAVAAREEMKKWRAEIKKRVEERKARSGGSQGQGTKIEEPEADAEAQADQVLADAEQRPSAEINPQAAQDSKPEEPLVTPDERKQIAHLQKLASLNTHGLDYLRAVVALAENKPAEALALLESASEGLKRRPGLHLQIGETYQRLRKWREAEGAFEHALKLDPDNPHACVGLARCHLARRQWRLAAASALKAIHLLHYYPLAHFLLGLALIRDGQRERAAQAWQDCVALNPAYWPAHLRLARFYKSTDASRSADHLDKARSSRQQAIERARGEISGQSPLKIPAHQAGVPNAQTSVLSHEASGTTEHSAPSTEHFVFPPKILGQPRAPFGKDAVVLVTGLPRSGTSLLMQMLTAGGVPPLTDEQRGADEDNPRGYFELEAVKSLAQDASCLKAADGKAVKVVLPLLPHVPADKHYHVLFIERDLDEIFASQKAMLDRTGQSAHDPASVRPAYERLLRMGRRVLSTSPRARALRLGHRWVIQNPHAAAEAIAAFLDLDLDVKTMAACVDPRLHRQRRETAGV